MHTSRMNKVCIYTHQLVAPTAPPPCCHYLPAVPSTLTYTAEVSDQHNYYIPHYLPTIIIPYCKEMGLL